MTPYRVAHVGAGPRGIVHVDGFPRNPDRFELVGVCDLDAGKLAPAACPTGCSGWTIG